MRQGYDEGHGMSIDHETLEALDAAGISLVASVEGPWGGITVDLAPNDVEAFIRDRDEWFAQKSGVLKSQYRDWLATYGEPRCGAMTAKGARCKNSVSGGIQRPLEVWLQEDGGFCHLHSGLTSKEARQR